MSVDLGDLLRQAGGDPSEPSDPDDIWRRGRRRRRARTVVASAAGVVVVAALAVVPLTASGGLQPVIEPIGQEEGDAPPADDGDATADETAEAGDDAATGEEVTSDEDGASSDLQGLQDHEASLLQRLLEEERQRQLDAERETEAEREAEAQAIGPDPDRMADPCAVHEDGEMRAFIDVVSPVEGQPVSGELELVGCSSVFEGTIQYRILDANEQTLLEDFTTATAGGPAIGEFRVTIELPSTGDLYVEVYWEDVATGDEAHPDGPERDLVRIPIEAS